MSPRMMMPLNMNEDNSSFAPFVARSRLLNVAMVARLSSGQNQHLGSNQIFHIFPFYGFRVQSLKDGYKHLNIKFRNDQKFMDCCLSIHWKFLSFQLTPKTLYSKPTRRNYILISNVNDSNKSLLNDHKKHFKTLKSIGLGGDEIPEDPKISFW